MLGNEKVLVAQCRECRETFEATIRWDPSDGTIIYPSPLIDLAQEHHNIDCHLPLSHNGYGLFLTQEQVTAENCSDDRLPGPLGWLVLSSQCFPQGTVYDEQLKD